MRLRPDSGAEEIYSALAIEWDLCFGWCSTSRFVNRGHAPIKAWYNPVRLHSALRCRSPMTYEVAL